MHVERRGGVIPGSVTPAHGSWVQGTDARVYVSMGTVTLNLSCLIAKGLFNI